MASELDTVWEGGQIVTGLRPEDDMSDRSSRRSSTRASTASGKSRAKRGQAKHLSGSFTSWANCPETWNQVPYAFV